MSPSTCPCCTTAPPPPCSRRNCVCNDVSCASRSSAPVMTRFDARQMSLSCAPSGTAPRAAPRVMSERGSSSHLHRLGELLAVHRYGDGVSPGQHVESTAAAATSTAAAPSSPPPCSASLCAAARRARNAASDVSAPRRAAACGARRRRRHHARHDRRRRFRPAHPCEDPTRRDSVPRRPPRGACVARRGRPCRRS